MCTKQRQWLRFWRSGKRARKTIPNSAPPNVHPNTMMLVMMEFIACATFPAERPAMLAAIPKFALEFYLMLAVEPIKGTDRNTSAEGVQTRRRTSSLATFERDRASVHRWLADYCRTTVTRVRQYRGIAQELAQNPRKPLILSPVGNELPDTLISYC
jgi:hypothetical protein